MIMKKTLILLALALTALAPVTGQTVKQLENERKATLQKMEATSKMLDQTKQSQQSSLNKLNLLTFSHQLFYNALVGAPDAHAKNYSLLLGAGGAAMLAPMYDVASGLAYERLRSRLRLAMSVGGENRVGRVGAGALERYVGAGDPKLAALLERAGLTLASCRALMADLAQEIPVSMTEVFEESAGIPGADELREHLLEPVAANCRRTLALL